LKPVALTFVTLQPRNSRSRKNTHTSGTTIPPRALAAATSIEVMRFWTASERG